MPFHLRVYAGTAGHSAWFSDDLGETWVHPNSHSGLYLEARVWSFASHAAVPEHVYAGTDEGVYRWDERSARWAQLASPMRDVWAVAVDPQDERRISRAAGPRDFSVRTTPAPAGSRWTSSAWRHFRT